MSKSSLSPTIDILSRIGRLPKDLQDIILEFLPFKFHVRLGCFKLATQSRARFPLYVEIARPVDQMLFQYELTFVDNLFHITYTKYFDETPVKALESQVENPFLYFSNIKELKSYHGSISYSRPNSAGCLTLMSQKINESIYFYYEIEILKLHPLGAMWEYCNVMNDLKLIKYLFRKNYLTVWKRASFRFATAHYSGFEREIVLTSFWAAKMLINDMLADKEPSQLYINGNFTKPYPKETLTQEFFNDDSNFAIFIHT